MILNSDIYLYDPLWEKADNELVNRDSIGLFKRLIDLYLVACAIGIKDDKTITEIEVPLTSPKSIGRSTIGSYANYDISNQIEFMLQNALLNSNTIKLGIEERIKLAFNPDYNVQGLNATTFLTGFANYGLQKIYEHVNSEAPMLVIDELYHYFESLIESDYDDIFKNLTLEELKNSI